MSTMTTGRTPSAEEILRLLELALLEAHQALESAPNGVLVAPDVPLPPRVKARLSRLLRDARVTLTGVALRFGVTSERYDELARASSRLNEALKTVDRARHDPVVAHASRAAKRFAEELERAAHNRQQRHHKEESRLKTTRSR